MHINESLHSNYTLKLPFIRLQMIRQYTPVEKSRQCLFLNCECADKFAIAYILSVISEVRCIAVPLYINNYLS